MAGPADNPSLAVAQNAANTAAINNTTLGQAKPDVEQKALGDVSFFDAVMEKGLLSAVKGLVQVNFSNPQSSSPVEAFSTRGVAAAEMAGLSKANNGQDNAILRMLKTLISNREITDMTAGVGGDANTMVAATPIEAPQQPDFGALLGSNEGMGKYSVADISGGGNLTPIGPMQQGGNYIS